jgi:hypothetical protein
MGEEPVAWQHGRGGFLSINKNRFPNQQMLANGWIPLYTHPPRREWVGLTLFFALMFFTGVWIWSLLI